MSVAAARRSAFLSSVGLADRMLADRHDRALAREIDAALDEIETGLARELRFADEVADVSARYLLEAGGKRVRPLLTLLTSQLGDGITPEVLVAAETVELTHLASLYHDDVMDEAAMRRGVPSAQHVFGNAVAVLTGDLLFARASQLIAQLGERAIRLQAGTFERLCLGQLHETIGPRPGDDPIEHYLQVLADKTGSLIAAAAQFGVVFSNADSRFEAAMIDFGEKVGIAFQLTDDVLDLAPGAQTGKTAGTDLRAGVVTLPLLKLRAREDAASVALLAELEERVIGAPEGVDVEASVARLREHEVTAETAAEARRWSAEAIDAIAPLPEGPVKKALTRFAESVVDRTN